MKSNQIIKIILYVLIIIFIFLLIRNNREGYLQDLNVGKWKFQSTESNLVTKVQEQGKDKEFIVDGSKIVAYNSGENELGLISKSVNENNVGWVGMGTGLALGSYNLITQPGDSAIIWGENSKGLVLAKHTGDKGGVRIDENGDLHVYGKIFVHSGPNDGGKNVWSIYNSGNSENSPDSLKFKRDDGPDVVIPGNCGKNLC